MNTFSVSGYAMIHYHNVSKFTRSIGITCKGALFIMFAYRAVFLVIAGEKYTSTSTVAMAL
jgi:hypothetical protein